MTSEFDRSAELLIQANRLNDCERGDYALAGYRTLRALGQATILSEIFDLEQEAGRLLADETLGCEAADVISVQSFAEISADMEALNG